MRRQDVENFRHPHTGEAFTLRVDEAEGDEIKSGALLTASDTVSIVRGIPRFCPEDNYAKSFGYQWNEFATTQLDSKAAWGPVSAERLFGDTGWPRDLSGQRILEAGSGMGRFTEVLAGSGASICTFDYSTAVEANVQNNSGAANVCFAQADIYSPPYEPGSFDKVLCIGVLQHCPRPKQAFLSLVRFLKPGGHIVIDHYRLWWQCMFYGKYYLRPFTRRLRHRTLHRFVRFHVGWVYPLTGHIYRLLGRPVRAFAWGLGMADYRGVFKMSDAAHRELALLDTFDMLAPAYDRPRTMGMIRRWCEEAGLDHIEIARGGTGILARARRPL